MLCISYCFPEFCVKTDRKDLRMGDTCSSWDTEDLLTLMTSYKECLHTFTNDWCPQRKQKLELTEDCGGLCRRWIHWKVYVFSMHILKPISHAINIYLNEDRDEEKLKVWTESRPEDFFFLEISSQTSPDFSEIRNSWIHIKCVR